MSRSNVAQRLDLAVRPREVWSSPASSRSASQPHILRHTTAMHLLQAGVPFNVIRLVARSREPDDNPSLPSKADLAMKEKSTRSA